MSLALVAALSLGASAVAAEYRLMQGNVVIVDNSALIAPPPTPQAPADPDDPNAGQALNLLVMGSDSRSGENADLGGSADGMRSDTAIVVHVSADRTRMDLVSIPRDSHVQIPPCKFYDGTTSRSQSGRFNAAFSTGAKNGDVGEAAACAITTVQALTGLTIDGWIVADFAGFRDMVDALGTVDICIPNDMDSDEAELHLTAGLHHLNGTEALALARARKGTGLGDGSDLMRMGRQQELLGAIAQKVFSMNLLTNLVQLNGFLAAATRSVSADPETGNLLNLAGLAFSLRNTPASNITFMTIPYATYPDDHNQVIWTSEADDIWSRLAADLPMVETATPTETTTPGATMPPATTAPADPLETPTPGVDPITASDVQTVCSP